MSELYSPIILKNPGFPPVTIQTSRQGYVRVRCHSTRLEFQQCCKERNVHPIHLPLCNYTSWVKEADDYIASLKGGEAALWNETIDDTPKHMLVEKHALKKPDFVLACLSHSRNVTDCCAAFGVPRRCLFYCDMTNIEHETPDVKQCSKIDWTNFLAISYTVKFNGILGSKLYITEHNVQYPKELGCEPSEKNRKIWISASVSNIPIYGDRACEFFRLSPVFNESTNMFHDRPGVNISTPFADLDALECLASDNFIGSCYVASSFVSAYYYKFIEHAKSVYNFTPEYNLIGAAYDWRYPPDAQKQFFASLTLEIERRVNATSLPAIFVAHSMGNKVLNYFLTRETTAEWRKRYINMTINVAPAFGGSVATMQELLTGNPIQWLGLGLDQETVRNFTRAVPSVASLLPSQNVFNTSRSLLTVAEGLKNFTSGNMLEFLSFINSSHLAVHYGKSEEKPQDVPMLVIIGNKTSSTPSRYMYSKSSEEPIGHHVANGDGRMEAATIEELCDRWKKHGASIEMKELPLEHTELIMSEKFFDIFGKVVVGKLPDGEYYPVLRNVMLYRGDSLCFSAKSHATCPSRKSVKILRAREVASFVCFHKSSKMAVYLKKSVAENMIFDLSEFAVTFSTMIDVAEKCADL